ncbi:oxygen-independent coproporphyrinogen III oxidase [Flammeovirga kamogawensis]|uniref:Coproporphyrinogen-III oxidase n=1 Tax=Flammeovirga kamogawensis TaxID=373891 RepID=A0ABX8H1I9_9BACT|nr:oxygen-independent coproporphyrinogen III oxidase [Flammeovirga kamogawensis]MBB6459452.1 oxygen-independent coproporphyrinogen-3 oxidase [Flammeovirga kamogawensis]QWG09005.1 oxygen-independent coproporphyrinogen III oxidase [Flammeovirga kamogawensis]TRX67293.1 oxygen-independent coproporphyrinogen III oxidase [Flammeovirga kamogawensis]
MENKSLVRKYNVPGPRYTSYPTVPFWDNDPTIEEWCQHVSDAFKTSNSKDGISVYIHLPYCEKLCTFCGCNKRITINHSVEDSYIDALLKEWQMYIAVFGEERPRIKEIHLGGGTPTFFSPENLQRLINGIFTSADKCEDAELGFEANPVNTTDEHLKALFDVGFTRLSLGIQDFDPIVQKAINRVQSFEQVEHVTNKAREIGYTSINFDLVFGLPFQKLACVKETIEKSNSLRPDRIAYYSYAHVPWTAPGQRGFSDDDLPSNDEKRALYEVGKEMFEEAGYVEIGMDHFALPTDALAIAADNKVLHRNFMGYAPTYTKLMVGLGCSSISDSWTAFAQNLKKVEEYKKTVNEGKLPIYRGHILSEEDLLVRKHILNVMCHFETSWDEETSQLPLFKTLAEKLEEMINDGLVLLGENHLEVTEKGRPFVRNICMTLDARMLVAKPQSRIFSSTI